MNAHCDRRPAGEHTKRPCRDQLHHGHEKRPKLKQSHGTKSESMRMDPLCGAQVQWTTTPLEHATAFPDTFQLPIEPKSGPYRMTHFWRTTTSNYARILIAGSSISTSYPNYYPSEYGVFKYFVLRISPAYKGCKIVMSFSKETHPYDREQRRITKVPKR